MIPSDATKKFRGSIYLIVLLACLSYLPNLSSPYLFDDLEFVAQNQELWTIKSVSTLFSFQPQPTKPVTNFFLGLGFLLGNGHPAHQRLLSVLLHIFCAVLLFLNLYTFLKPRATNYLSHSLGPTLLFSLSPLLVESVMIIQFRGELLASFFTLLGMLMVQKIPTKATLPTHWIGIFFVCLFLHVAATASKEVFGAIFPLSLLITYLAATPLKTKMLYVILLSTFCVVPFVGLQLSLKNKGTYSYSGNIHLDKFGDATHIELSTRSLFEGVSKAVGVLPLTTVRLKNRFGLFYGLSTGTYLSILSVFGALCVLLYKFSSPIVRWGLGLFLIGSTFYLAIPNANLGSEHYWYFASVGLYILIFQSLIAFSNKIALPALKSRPLWVVIPVSAWLLFVQLDRLHQMKNTESFYRAELKNHPETVTSWVDVANTESAKRTPDALNQAEAYLKKAQTINPEHPTIWAAKFMLAYYRNDLTTLETIMDKLLNQTWPPPRLASFHFHHAILNLMHQNCDGAEESLDQALALWPQNPQFQKFKQKLESDSFQYCASKT